VGVVGHRRRALDGLVVVAVGDDDLGTVAGDGLDAALHRALRHEDRRGHAEHARHAGDGAAMIPIGGGDEVQVTTAVGDGLLQLREGGLLVLGQPQVLHDRAVTRPRRAQDLEGRHPHSGRLVLHPHRPDAEPRGSRLGLTQRRRHEAGDGAMEADARELRRLDDLAVDVRILDEACGSHFPISLARGAGRATADGVTLRWCGAAEDARPSRTPDPRCDRRPQRPTRPSIAKQGPNGWRSGMLPPPG